VQQIFPSLPPDRQATVIYELDLAGALSRDYLLLVVLSCVIATFGLVLNSAAVIIGAMLIAPLMSPILRCALALVCGDLKRIGRALGALLVGVLLACGISMLFGLLVSAGPFNFIEEVPAEILNRTRPNLFDLVVALAGGMAAAYALAQPHVSAALPGVAIATALMPPVCTIGIGIAQRRADISAGALLLFLVNFTAIVFASSLTFGLLGFRPATPAMRTLVLSRALLIEGVLVLLVTVPLIWFTISVIRAAQQNQVIQRTLIGELDQLGDSSLVSFERQEAPEHLAIVATIRSPHNLTFSQASRIQHELAARLQLPVSLKLLIVPVTSLNPIEPPTLTPTLPPDATVTPVPTATVTPTLLPTSTATPRPTPTPTASPTATPLPTPTPVAYAAIGATGRRGGNVRRAPGRTAVVTTLRDGALVQLTGQQVAADGLNWAQIILPDGRVGWVAEEYLIPYQLFIAPNAS